MKTINELKAERSALLKRNNEIYALVEKEQRAITEDEIAEVNENVVKRMKLADEISELMAELNEKQPQAKQQQRGVNYVKAIKDCCCGTQKAILEMGYQSQLANCNQTNTLLSAINTMANGMERGFSSVAYETQRQTCDLLNAGNANTQRIIDVLNGHWSDELQRKYADAQLELSQMRQNAYLISQLKTTATT